MVITQRGLNLEIHGEGLGGPSFLMVHGAGGGARIWREAAEALSAEFRVAALDLSGHGGSRKLPAPATFDDYVDDVVAAAAALGGPVALCGHSMGGAVAQLTALRNPDAARGLVLVGTGARLRVMPALFDMLRADFAAAVGGMGAFAFSAKTDKCIADVLQEVTIKLDPEIVINDFRLCDGFDVMADVARIAHPALIVCGDEDRLTPLKYSKFLADNLSKNRLETMSGCGHMPMLEKPGEFARLCADFARSL